MTVLAVSACSGDGGPAGEDGRSSPHRFTVRSYTSEGAVRLVAVSEPRVVAYVSMERMEVYVDRDFRDRASWLLDAHISVSTWHWRIPLPGDDPGIPITPGDEAREFEELDLSLWDRAAPGVDDIRIVLADAQAAPARVSCAAVEGEESWLSADLSVATSVPSDTATIREDFYQVGSGALHADASCSTAAKDTVAVFGWGQRPPA